MADEPEPTAGEWVTVAEAARRLGMSKTWFGAIASEEGLRVGPRGGRPGVYWPDVEGYIQRSRITKVDDT